MNTSSAYGAICKKFELYKKAEWDMNLYYTYLNSFSTTESISEKTIDELKLRSYLYLNKKNEAENQVDIIASNDVTNIEKVLTTIDKTIANSLVDAKSLSSLSNIVNRKVIKKKVDEILDIYNLNSENENHLIVNNFELKQNYPNPFNPSTTIKFSLPKMSNVKLTIYNVKGELVQTLLNSKNVEAGWHKVNFDGSKLSSGIYYYRIKADNFNADQRMLLLK